LYNSAVVLSSKGDLVACYRKILLYELDETWCTPGTERMLIQTEFGSLAPAICMDLNDNELIYWMWRAKPDILAFCTNWLNQDSPIDSYWKWRTPYWNGWFIGANRWGVDVNTPFRGESAIISPHKDTVAQAQIEGDAILIWDTENT
jgi:predicted amidohydrolase